MSTAAHTGPTSCFPAPTGLICQVDEALPQGVAAESFAPRIGGDQAAVHPRQSALGPLASLGMTPMVRGHVVGLAQVDGAVAARCLRAADGEGPGALRSMPGHRSGSSSPHRGPRVFAWLVEREVAFTGLEQGCRKVTHSSVVHTMTLAGFLPL